MPAFQLSGWEMEINLGSARRGVGQEKYSASGSAWYHVRA